MYKLKNALNQCQKYMRTACNSIFLILKTILYDVLFNAAIQTIKVSIVLVFPAYGLYLFYIEKMDDLKFDLFNIYVLTPLAILVAFSGLFFNRARTFSIEDQRHINSVNAAEHALRGGIFYAVALVWGFIITSIYLMFKLDGDIIPATLLKSLYIPSLTLVFLAYVELYFSVSKIWPDLNSNLKNSNY